MQHQHSPQSKLLTHYVGNKFAKTGFFFKKVEVSVTGKVNLKLQTGTNTKNRGQILPYFMIIYRKQ